MNRPVPVQASVKASSLAERMNADNASLKLHRQAAAREPLGVSAFLTEVLRRLLSPRGVRFDTNPDAARDPQPIRH